jgi:hypothetical protein
MPVTYNTFKSEAGFDGIAGGVQAGVGGKIAYYPANGTEVDDLTALTWTPGTNTLAISGTLTASQFIGPGIGAVLGDTPPLQPYAQSGTIWFDTSSGKLYIYYDDGTSQQWVQPMTPSYGGGGGGGGGTVGNGVAGRLAYYSSSGSTIDDLSNLSFASNTLSVTGSINVSAQKNYVRFHWDSLNDLNNEANPTTWHGMIAHVHSTGRVYFAHAGAWTALANLSDLGSGVSGILAGDNITISNNNGVVTINAVTGGGGGGISLEDAQDGAATLFANGAHNGITFVYNDASNAINATVNDVALGSSTSGNYVANVATGNGLTGGGVGSEGANLTLAVDTTVVTTLTGSQTLTNKTINGTLNTITNIGNAALTNSAITINGTSVALGGTITVTGSGATTLDSLTDVVITSASSGQVLKYNGTNWINDTDATGGGGANTFSSFAVAGQSTVVADNSTDTLTLAAGSGIQITTDSGLDVITITNNASIFNTIAVAGQSDVVADTSSDTLTLAAGSGISITTNNTTDTITLTASLAFTGLTDSASLTIDKIYMPAITMLTVTANGSSSYSFDQYTGTNPTIYALNGATIAFNLTVGGSHPFLIQTSGGANYNTGLVHVSTTGTVTTGSGAQGQTSGTLYWKIPNSINGNYRYICSNHGVMTGTITIKDFVSI